MSIFLYPIGMSNKSRSQYQPGGSGIHRNINARPGSEYLSKKVSFRLQFAKKVSKRARSWFELRIGIYSETPNGLKSRLTKDNALYHRLSTHYECSMATDNSAMSPKFVRYSLKIVRYSLNIVRYSLKIVRYSLKIVRYSTVLVVFRTRMRS